MEDFNFLRRGTSAAAAPPGKVATGRRGKPPTCYEDMFGGPQAYVADAPPSSLLPARPEDYREIFGAAAACSIPVLDLPPPGDGYESRQCSALDYLDIFGGFDGRDFAASYEELFPSNGVGTPLPPSGLGDSPPGANNSNSRGLNSMDAKQEMPVPGVIVEGPHRDQVGFSLNGVAHHLNVGTSQSNRSNHMSRSSKNDPINGKIHKNLVCAIPGYPCVVDKPDSQVDVDIIFNLNCSKGTSEGQHLRKTVLSSSSCSDIKYSVNGMKADKKSSLLECSGSTSTWCKNQLTVPSSNDLSAKVSINHNLPENFIEKRTEESYQNKTVHPVMSADPGNDLRAKCTASEDVLTNDEHHSSSSSNGCSTLSGTKSFPDYLANDISIDAANANIGIADATHFKKSNSGSPTCTSSQCLEKDIAEQKESNPMLSCPTTAPLNESQHSCSSSTPSISSLDRPHSDSVFVTVSDINLRTQPSRGPPPAWPPPARPPSKASISERSLRRTLTDYQNHDVRSGIAYKSHSFKQAVRDGSPDTFDVEVDANSAAAASVAAIKEAMELAQAKLKIAKVSMERKRDNFQGRRKFSFNDEIRGINKGGVGETIQENQSIREEVLFQLATKNNDGKGNVYAAEKMATTFGASKLTVDYKEREKNCGSAEESLQAMHWGEAGLSDLSHKKVDKVGEWKVEEQFYEFIQSGKEFNEVPENSLNESSEERSHAGTGIVGEELNVSELKKNEKLLASPKVTDWEGDSDKKQDPSLTSKEQTEDLQKHAQDSYGKGESVLKLEETISGHHQEKKPGQVQELLESEPETKWRTSEEAFICELNERNPRVNNDASKCKSIDEHQSQAKEQRISDENCQCEKEINVTEKQLRERDKDNKAWGKLSELDKNKKEATITPVSHVSAEGTHLKTSSKSCENENLKLSIKADRYDCLHAGKETDPKETRLLFEQDKRKMPNITNRTFEWAENDSELKEASEEGNEGTFNLAQESNGCSGNTKKLREIQKLPIETEKELLQKVAKQNTSLRAGVADDFDDAITAARGDYKKKMDENSNEETKKTESAQGVCKKTGNEKKKGDAQRALEEQGNICRVAQESSENHIAGWSVENDCESDETGEDMNEEKMESEQARNLKETKEMETRKLEENERESIKLEEERERKWIELEEEKERDKLLEEAKNREKRKLEEEKERERRKLEEKERERRMLEEEMESRRKLQKEEEKERKKLEEEERERKKLEEEKKLEAEWERKKLEEELEGKKKLEEEERERRKIEEKERKKNKQEEEHKERSNLEERERQRLEEVERERKKLEEKERERRRIEEEKVRERQKIEEEKIREKKLEEEKEREQRKIEEKEKERIKLEEEWEREREREKDRQAVERATREAHERASVEARERAERAVVERVTAEARQRAMAEARERAEKASAESLEKCMAEKASREARLRAERAAVERATAEARERAAEKAIAEKATQDAREHAEKLATTSRDGVKQNAASFTNENFGGSEGESAIRCKARMERHQRTVERAAKALAEKNLRDIIAQREQAERNRLAETLDADVKRWSSGKEGNLRALLSTLQYILGPETGWQPISLTEVVTAPAVKKAYRKATLCVHPDKLQQRGASIQQKYICEKVFDLLKEAWNKFNSEVQ